MTRSRNTLALLLCLVAMLVSLTGCSHDAFPPDYLFSPDGQTVSADCYVFSSDGHTVAARCWEYTPKPEWVGDGTVRQHVLWCDLDTPDDVQQHLIVSEVLMGDEEREDIRRITFSPDSRYLLVSTGQRLVRIDTDTGRADEMPPIDGELTSAVIAEGGSVAYVAHVQTPLGVTRQVWRCPADSDNPVMIYKGAGSPDLFPGPDADTLRAAQWLATVAETWSPDGQFVIFDESARLLILDAQAGEAYRLGDRAWGSYDIAWRADSAAALCLGSPPVKPDEPTDQSRQALWIDTTRGIGTADLTTPFLEQVQLLREELQHPAGTTHRKLTRYSWTSTDPFIVACMHRPTSPDAPNAPDASRRITFDPTDATFHTRHTPPFGTSRPMNMSMLTLTPEGLHTVEFVSKDKLEVTPVEPERAVEADVPADADDVEDVPAEVIPAE